MNWVNLLAAIQQMDPIVAVMATVMTIYFLYKSGSNIIPKVLGKKKPLKNSGLMDLHRNCANSTSIAVILERVMDKSDKIFRIRYQETLYEQMNDAELMWDNSRDALMENFLKVLNDDPDVLPTKNEINASVFLYGKIIDSMEVDILGIVRRWMRKNHFADKTSIEYEAYIDDKTKLLHDKVVRLFDESYNEDRLLTPRLDVKKAFDADHMSEVNKGIRTFFLKAKATAEESARRIAVLEEEISKI